MTKKITELLDALKLARTANNQIATHFGLDHLWHNLIDLTDCRWTNYGGRHGEFGWWDEGTELTEEEFREESAMYGCEVYGTSCWLSDDECFTLYVGDDGCGNRDMYIFRNSNKVEE